jgi:hypothetical protein
MDSCEECSDLIWDGLVENGSEPWYIPNLFEDFLLLIKIKQRHAIEDP